MHLDRYNLKAGEAFRVFEFTSIGPKGKIKKMVQYSHTNYQGLYNLGFGDKNPITGEIDDQAISNNDDSEKVLATVIATLYVFTSEYPDALVYATGSTISRTRLYRMGISKFLDHVITDFEVYGEIEKGWEPFKKDMDYNGFLVKRKFKLYGY
jgi:hypothetical protein